MAKSTSAYPGQEKKIKALYPSPFGSHSSMLDNQATEALGNIALVILRDEHGLYTTEKSRLDSGLADPNRYKTERLTKLFQKDKEAHQ